VPDIFGDDIQLSGFNINGGFPKQLSIY